MKATLEHSILRRGFTLVEVMIVVAIIALLATIAVPSFLRARTQSQTVICQEKQQLIYDQISIYSIENGVPLTLAQWPNLCAARNCLAPGGDALYVQNWDAFECPVTDSQSQHDYAYVFDAGQMVSVRCNNASGPVQDQHNE